ncbi:hypothetical protein DFH06DRAFT_1295793 [Mycena polygramma]|nr:hypothetical protein DFH06DRAFT_1295793 [Mycena polygramma]
MHGEARGVCVPVWGGPRPDEIAVLVRCGWGARAEMQTGSHGHADEGCDGEVRSRWRRAWRMGALLVLRIGHYEEDDRRSAGKGRSALSRWTRRALPDTARAQQSTRRAFYSLPLHWHDLGAQVWQAAARMSGAAGVDADDECAHAPRAEGHARAHWLRRRGNAQADSVMRGARKGGLVSCRMTLPDAGEESRVDGGERRRHRRHAGSLRQVLLQCVWGRMRGGVLYSGRPMCKGYAREMCARVGLGLSLARPRVGIGLRWLEGRVHPCYRCVDTRRVMATSAVCGGDVFRRRSAVDTRATRGRGGNASSRRGRAVRGCACAEMRGCGAMRCNELWWASGYSQHRPSACAEDLKIGVYRTPRHLTHGARCLYSHLRQSPLMLPQHMDEMECIERGRGVHAAVAAVLRCLGHARMRLKEAAQPDKYVLCGGGAGSANPRGLHAPPPAIVDWNLLHAPVTAESSRDEEGCSYMHSRLRTLYFFVSVFVVASANIRKTVARAPTQLNSRYSPQRASLQTTAHAQFGFTNSANSGIIHCNSGMPTIPRLRRPVHHEIEDLAKRSIAVSPVRIGVEPS